MAWLIALAFCAGLGALVLKDRERFALRVALDAEKRAHGITREERDALRAESGRAAGEREQLRNRIDELKALREGGGAYR